MKRVISVFLAAAVVLLSLSGVSLAPKASAMEDAFVLISICVTTSDGYLSPYYALKKYDAVNDEELVYVSLKCALRGADSDVPIGSLADSSPTRVIKISSESLDLSVSPTTVVSQSIFPNSSAVNHRSAPGELTSTYDTINSQLLLYLNLQNPDMFTPYPAKGYSIHYNIGFLAQERPAPQGEIKASMAITEIKFATDNSLRVYDTNTLKYIIVKHDTDADTYVNYYDILDPDRVELFKLVFDSTFPYEFKYVSYQGNKAGFNYVGRLICKNSFNADVDITDSVKKVLTFFGLDFRYNTYVPPKYFEERTLGNPIVVSDKYNTVTADVTDSDTTDVADTDDHADRSWIVLAASALLCACALRMVLKQSAA